MWQDAAWSAVARSRKVDLPAFDVLSSEGVMVMSEDEAARQDIRPLRIGLLNLMPKKIQTENQFARLIGATPLQIELTTSGANASPMTFRWDLDGATATAPPPASSPSFLIL